MKRLACLLAIVSCGKQADAPAGKSDPGKESRAAKDSVPAKNPTPSGGGAVSCEAALKNSYAVVEASDNAALKKASVENPIEKSLALCKSQSWSADLRSCLAAAKSIDDVYHDCYVRPLKGHPLKVKRTFDVGDAEALKTADPPLFTQDGDFFQVKENCGLLFADSEKGGAGMFVLCGGKTRGPMTTPDEVTQAFAVLSADLAKQHEMVMGMIDNMPSGRFGGWKVCDQAGNCHIE